MLAKLTKKYAIGDRMEKELYRDIEDWLSAYISYSPDIELSVTSQSQMIRHGIHLSDIHELLESGRVIWADRDDSVGMFAIIGRNCDEREITIHGRFVSASTWVSIDEIRITE